MSFTLESGVTVEGFVVPNAVPFWERMEDDAVAGDELPEQEEHRPLGHSR
jgi:hypothetical protein